jgi:hypothetical protein
VYLAVSGAPAQVEAAPALIKSIAGEPAFEL